MDIQPRTPMEKPDSAPRSPASAAQTLLTRVPQHITAIKDEWAALSRGTWDSKRFEQLFRRVQGLGEATGRAGFGEISESAFSLEIYLSTFSGDDKRPSLERAREVAELVHVLEAAVLSALEAGPVGNATQASGEGAVYCLLSRSDLVPGLDKLLQASHWRCVMFRDLTQLSGELERGWPSALIVDASLLAQASSLLETIRKQRAGAAQSLPLVFVSSSSDIKRRLAAMRAGADAYFSAPLDTESVVRRVTQLAKDGERAAYRVLVVEDDPSQAKFAATILRKGGMETEVLTDALETVGAIQRFKPDLVLMDVYMPNASGVELTRLIRQDKHLLTLPIVYLSGEQNPEKQQTALSVGADDFIAKPIRPKHLIGTVTNRIRRARQLQDGLDQGEQPRIDPATGLTSKQHFFERVDALLSGQAGDDAPAAMLHIDLEDFPALCSQVSPTALETLIAMVGKRISNQLGEGDVATRAGRNSFALLLRQPGGGNLRPIAERLVRSLAEPPFEVEGRPIRLRASSRLWPLHRELTQGSASLEAPSAAPAPGTANVASGRRERDAVVARVRDAIAAGHLELSFRRISDSQDRSVRGYELALCTNGQDGLAPASEVRRIAAEAGLLRQLDRHTLERAVAFLEDQQGRAEQTLLARISPQSLSDPEALGELRNSLRARHLAGTGLVFGLSLAEIGADPKTARNLVRRLKEMGIATALTRFTGSDAAARMLSFLEAGYVEADAAVARKGRAALAALVDVAHRAGALVIIAEEAVPQGGEPPDACGADLWVGRFVRPGDRRGQGTREPASD